MREVAENELNKVTIKVFEKDHERLEVVKKRLKKTLGSRSIDFADAVEAVLDQLQPSSDDHGSSPEPGDLVRAGKYELSPAEQELVERFLEWWHIPHNESSADQAFKAGVARLLKVPTPPSKGSTKK